MALLYRRAAGLYGRVALKVYVPTPCYEYEAQIHWDWSVGVNPSFMKPISAFAPLLYQEWSSYGPLIQPVKIEMIANSNGSNMPTLLRLTGLGQGHQLFGYYDVVIIYKNL